MLKKIVQNILPIAIVLAMVLLFIPIPEMVVNILYLLSWALSMLLFNTVRNSKEKIQALPRYLLFLTLINMSLQMSYMSIILNYKSKINLEKISGDGYFFIIAIIISITLLVLSNIFIRKRVKEICKAEKEKKRKLEDQIYYSNLEGSSLFLKGNLNAITYMYIVVLVGGSLTGIFVHKLSIIEALNLVSITAVIPTTLSTIITACLTYTAAYTVLED